MASLSRLAPQIRVLAVDLVVLESDHRELLPVLVAIGRFLENQHVLRFVVVGLPRIVSTCAFDMPSVTWS